METYFPILIFILTGFWPSIGMAKGLGRLQLMGKPVNTRDVWFVTSAASLVLLYCAVHSALDPHFLTRGNPELDGNSAIPRAGVARFFLWAPQPLVVLWVVARKDSARRRG